MFSADQLALLSSVKEQSVKQSWADAAREAVDTFPATMFASRCAAALRSLTSLEELGEDVPLGRFAISLCPIHHVFHLYDEVRALNAAKTVAVGVQSRIDTAATELDPAEAKRLRGRVLFARDAFYKSVKADTEALATYRKFGLPTTPQPTMAVASPSVPRVPHNMPAGAHGPNAAHQEQARRVKADIGITDTQLIEFYRCYRKKPYQTVAEAVNATLLVHNDFDRMAVYLCGHCTNLHIGHRSNQGSALTPAFFTRAIAKWHEMPNVAANFVRDKQLAKV